MRGRERERVGSPKLCCALSVSILLCLGPTRRETRSSCRLFFPSGRAVSCSSESFRALCFRRELVVCPSLVLGCVWVLVIGLLIIFVTRVLGFSPLDSTRTRRATTRRHCESRLGNGVSLSVCRSTSNAKRYASDARLFWMDPSPSSRRTIPLVGTGETEREREITHLDHNNKASSVSSFQ